MTIAQFRGINFEIEDDPEKRILFVLGIRKSGSSIFNSICTDLARANGYRYVDVAGTLFAAGILERFWAPDPEIGNLLRPGNLYGGFRSLPAALAGLPAFKSARKALLVRDPRDVLVSEYYSNAYSHTLPTEGQGKNTFAVEREKARSAELMDYVGGRIKELKRTCAPFIPLKDDPNTIVFRYEDIIFNKDVMIRDVCRFFGWTVTEERIGHILQWADVRPETERPTEFIRRVTPGDYREKLSPELVSQIQAELADFMSAYDYR